MNSSEIVNNSNMENNLHSDKSKSNKFKSCTNFASRVRLYTLTSNYLLSPTLKSRKLFDERSSNNLRCIKEKEDSIVFPFSPSRKDEDEEEDSIEYDGFIKLYPIKDNDDISDFNSNNNKKINKKFMVKRTQTFEKINCYKLDNNKKNYIRNKSAKNNNKYLLFF